MTGAHYQEPYISLNPNGQVPTLVDDDFVLTESSAILKYLADKFNLPSYPEGPEEAGAGQRADGLVQHGFYHDYAYAVVYPQIYPHHKRPSDELQKGTIAWGKELDQEVADGAQRQLARQGQQVPLTGDEITHRRLFRRRAADLRATSSATSSRPIRTSSAGWAK